MQTKVSGHKRVGKNKVTTVKSHKRTTASGNGNTYNSSQFADTTRKYRSQSKIPKKPVTPTKKVEKPEVHHSTLGMLKKDKGPVNAGRKHGRETVKKFVNSFRKSKH